MLDSRSLNTRANEEELAMIRDYILLPHMLTMVQRSIEDIESRHNLLKQLYVTAGRAIMNQISADMYRIRRDLTKRKIKILGDEQADLVIYHHFVCRGYEERFGIIREVMKAEISVRLAKYIKDLADRMNMRE